MSFLAWIGVAALVALVVLVVAAIAAYPDDNSF